MGNFATGLLGAIAGGAKAYGEVVDKRIDDKSAMDKMRSIEEFKADMEQKREARLKEQKIAENQKVREVAGEMAGKERGGKMDQARAIYEQSGMSPEDIALGVGATEEARQNVEPGREHYVAAMEQEGLLTAGQRVADMDKQAQTEYSRGRDAKDDQYKDAAGKRADRELDLRGQQLRQSISNAAAAAADAAESRANKKALMPLYEQLGMALAQEESAPGTMDGTVKSLKIKIKSLGGDVSAMETALRGPTQKVEVTTESEDGLRKEKRVVNERVGGSKQTAPAAGTRRVINGQQAEWDGRGWKAVK